jgi:hypothetical protein
MKSVFGGQGTQNPIKISTDSNTLATQQNTAVIYGLTSIMSAGMGLPTPQAPSGFGGSGISLPAISSATANVSSPLGAIESLVRPGLVSSSINYGGGSIPLGGSVSGGANPIASVLGLLGGGGGGSSATTAPFFGGSIPGIPSGGGFNLGGLFAQGGKSGGGFGGILGNFKGIDWGGFTRVPTDMVNGGQVVGSAGSHITGVGGLAGTGLVMGGTFLAQRGLLGADRGTTKGIFEGSLGGAAIGLKYGGPLGAAIGAAAGFGIGLGEKLAGVESPENEAKRLVKEQYGITINNQTAQQIVAVAQSKFAGRVSLAVRSPEVRDMLGLYAAGTGQNGSRVLSSLTPHSASLVEHGGSLFQAATYQYGNAYSFKSNLPVEGGMSTQQYPNPGGNQPINLSLNVGGKGISDFMTGNVVTSDYIQSSWASAQNSSNGRLQNAALFAQPGLITG